MNKRQNIYLIISDITLIRQIKFKIYQSATNFNYVCIKSSSIVFV